MKTTKKTFSFMFGVFKVWKADKSGMQVYSSGNTYNFSSIMNFISIITGKIHENRYNHKIPHACLATKQEIHLYFYSVKKRLQIKKYKTTQDLTYLTSKKMPLEGNSSHSAWAFTLRWEEQPILQWSWLWKRA